MTGVGNSQTAMGKPWSPTANSRTGSTRFMSATAKLETGSANSGIRSGNSLTATSCEGDPATQTCREHVKNRVLLPSRAAPGLRAGCQKCHLEKVGQTYPFDAR